jgi:transcriptional regulator with XRE-family HTH domain
MTTRFTTWLVEQMEEQELSMRETARRGGISHTWIANVVSERAEPTADFCLGIARALGKPPTLVLRVAGLIPPAPDAEDPVLSEAMQLFDQLPEQDQDRVLIFMRALEAAQQEEAEAQRRRGQQRRMANTGPRAVET